jgi:hypothetical protein
MSFRVTTFMMALLLLAGVQGLHQAYQVRIVAFNGQYAGINPSGPRNLVG